MPLLTDTSIARLLGKDIIIEPFSENCLMPMGYDLRVGDFVYALDMRLLRPENGVYTLPPRSTIQILTKESVWVSSRIGGTLHSRVSLVSKGLSHISTTVDPGWTGPLLITLRNTLDREFKLKKDDRLVTMVLYRTQRRAKGRHKKPDFLRDILIDQVKEQIQEEVDEYMERIKPVLGDTELLKSFRKAVEAANQPMSSKIANSARRTMTLNAVKYFGLGVLYILGLAILGINFYWDKISWLFNNQPYDTEVFAAQAAMLTTLIFLGTKLQQD
ncbi:dCTP deaminase [Desulfomonile tiedjei]|uniref:Deoxycytidine deaminase n=1 Tax=Desulfomonile tiedjei (strain ATCC 49306 / DSM 6799 / DCB-1) TaxID=706587 RepID=I4CE20_DESTA|nr:deoxycytidine deaminase [Desulfomonile tiedjei]AFM27811.1 deoxycytidine deaminase [Desulfomonile tiedjei DSM 6799]